MSLQDNLSNPQSYWNALLARFSLDVVLLVAF